MGCNFKVGDVVWCAGVGPMRVQIIGHTVQCQTVNHTTYWARCEDLAPWGKDVEWYEFYRSQLRSRIGDSSVQRLNQFMEIGQGSDSESYS